MKNIIFLCGLFISLGFFILSCGGGYEASTEAPATPVTLTTHTLSSSTAKVNWSGFREVDLSASGTFKEVTFTFPNLSGTLASMLNGSTANIITNSINSEDTVRDMNIVNILFGALADKKITARISNLSETDDKNGKFTLTVDLNAMSTNIVMTYSIASNKLTAKGDFDLFSVGMNSAIIALGNTAPHNGKTDNIVAVEFEVYLNGAEPATVVVETAPVVETFNASTYYQSNCAICHGNAGQGGAYTAIKGKSLSSYTSILTSFQNGSRTSPSAMSSLLKKLDTSNVDSLAKYLDTF